MLKKIKNKALASIKNRKGMTLVEVIVAITISIIVIGMTGGMLLSGTGLFNNAANKAEDERIASTILNFVVSELRYATDIDSDSISSNPPSPLSGRGLIYTMDISGKRAATGMIGYKRPFDTEGARNVYGESFYNGRKVGIRMQPVDINQPKVIIIFVDVYDKDGKRVYVDSATVEVPNIPYDKPPDKKMNAEPTDTVLLDYGALESRK